MAGEQGQGGRGRSGGAGRDQSRSAGASRGQGGSSSGSGRGRAGSAGQGRASGAGTGRSSGAGSSGSPSRRPQGSGTSRGQRPGGARYGNPGGSSSGRQPPGPEQPVGWLTGERPGSSRSDTSRAGQGASRGSSGGYSARPVRDRAASDSPRASSSRTGGPRTGGPRAASPRGDGPRTGGFRDDRPRSGGPRGDAPVQAVRVTVALGAAARAPAGSVTIAPVAVARAAMAPVKVVLGAAARVPVASVTIARVAVARARVAPAVMARAGIRPGAVPTGRLQAPPGRRGLPGVPPTAHPGMATAHAATGLPAVVRSAPIVPPAAARQVPDPMAIALLAAARQTDAPLVARPLDARPATGTPGAGDHPAGPRPPQDAQVLSGIARLPGVVQVPAALGAMRARIAIPPPAW